MGQKKDKKQNENSGLGLRGLMYHNGFILVCCFLVSVVVWFVMAAGSDMNRTTVIKDVPVSVSLSSQAEAEGLRRGVGPAGAPGDGGRRPTRTKASFTAGSPPRLPCWAGGASAGQSVR